MATAAETEREQRKENCIMVYSGPTKPEEEGWIRDCVCKLGTRYGEVRLSKLMLQRAVRVGETPVQFVQRVLNGKPWPIREENDTVVVTADVEAAI